MRSIKLILKLVVSRMRMSPGRFFVTHLGVVASTCAVVWVVSGYDALVSQFDENAGKYLGRYDALVMPSGSGSPGSPAAKIDPSLISRLQRDVGLMEVNPISNSRVSVTRVKHPSDTVAPESSLDLLVGHRPPVNGAPPIGPTMVSTPAEQPPYEMVDGDWLGTTTDEMAVVIGVETARQMGVTVGDDVLVTTFANQVRLNVVGLVQQVSEAPSFGRDRGTRGEANRSDGRQGASLSRPQESLPRSSRRSPVGPASDDGDGMDRMNRIGLPGGFVQGVATNAIYVRPSIADKINGAPTDPQVLQVAIRDTVSMQQFHELWGKIFAAHRPPLHLVDFDRVRSGMESSRSVSGQQSQAWAATGMASLAAVFIIFSVLSMGVSERTREFAMLRAVALTRSQIAAIIALESLMLAVVGWFGGLFAGWILVLVGSRVLPGLFSGGAVLGWSSIALSAVTVLVGAFGAAILPAWRATRISPLDVMQQRQGCKDPQSGSMFKRLVSLALLGLLLSAMTPVTVFALPMSDQWRYWCYRFATYPMLLMGMVLMAPTIVILCERLLGPILNPLLALDSRMMRTQFARNVWSAMGATLALSVGLGLFASTQIWGYSMLRPFTPGDWLPEALVAFHPVGLRQQDEQQVGQVSDVRPGEVMPLAIEQAKFDWGVGGPPSRLKFGDNGIVCGLDPAVAFGTERTMLPVQFVQGKRRSAIEAVASGDGCVVSEDFAMATGLGLGDHVKFIPPSAEDQRVSYRIAAVVSLPGWQWVTKFSGMRRHFGRTGAILFAERNRVRSDFDLGRTEFFWLNLEPGSDLASVEEKFQAIAQQNAGETFTADGQGQVVAYRPFARMTTTQNVSKAIKSRADGMIWGMSYLPLVTLAIMSLAVANTVIASVRSRTWEFGVMRSIGVTRSQLVRLVLAETILIAIAACLLSLVFGIIAGWCGVGMAQFGGWFAGPPSFMVPWAQLAVGFAMTITLCLLAGLWPAVNAGRSEPLGLLQAGRSMQ